MLEFRRYGPATPTPGRGAQPEGSGRVEAPPLDDEPDGCPGFLPERTHGLSHRAGAFSQREGHPGAGSGMEANEEMALSPGTSHALGNATSRLVITDPGLHGVEARLLPNCR